MNAILSIRNLNLSVKTGHIIQGNKQILHDISFDVPLGKATAYLGPNGAGKTSTFRILMGLCKPDSGQVSFRDTPISSKLPANLIGFMPEQPYFYKNLTPRELLTSFAKLSGVQNNIPSLIASWAEKLNFGNVLDQRLSTCSKGQIQRVGLAQSLLHQPEMIILDEPFSGLDPLGRECVRAAITDEIQRGATLLFSSHILSDAETLCDHTIVLRQGRVAYSGDMRQLLANEDHWIIRAEWSGNDLPHIDGVDITIEQNLLTARTGSESAKQAILEKLLHNSFARIVEVHPERRSLEEAFVSLLDQGKK